MWLNMIMYLDVLLEAGILIIFAVFSVVIPTNIRKADKSLDTFSTSKPVKMGEILDETGLSESNFSSPIQNSANNRFMMQPRLTRSQSSLDSIAPLPSQSMMCVMFSVSSPCSTDLGRIDFVKKLKSIKNIVENDIDIFVVDSGHTREPIDDTEYVIKTEVSDKINYVYYPEASRLVSLYWTSKYWIPYLFTCNLVGDYIYTLIVDDQVEFPENFKLPSGQYLMNNPKIKTMYLPVTETPSIDGDFIGRWKERIELVSVYNACGSTAHAGDVGIPQIWERNTFEMTCFNMKDRIHDRMLSVLELKSNGRNLLTDRGSSQMSVWVSEGGKNQPTVTSRWYLGSRQGFSLASNLYELLHPSSFLHFPSLLTKFVVLLEIANVFFDSIRLCMIPNMLLRDPVGFAISTIFVSFVSMLPYLINLLVNIKYERMRIRKLAYITLVFPIQFILIELPSRALRLFSLNVRPSIFTMYENDLTIGEREEELRDLPIVPPHPYPHWSSVWM
jgi:hypothetical protein